MKIAIAGKKTETANYVRYIQSANIRSGNTQSGNTQSGNIQSGNIQSGNTQSGNTQSGNIATIVTLNMEEIAACDALLLPGGGDITPAFFGEVNRGSRNIDTALDIRQFQAFDLALEKKMPVLGICKGMQIINVALGGGIIQDLEPPSRERHSYDNGDKYHNSIILPNSWLHSLYGDGTTVNSAHHQALGKTGKGLAVIQRCPADGCIEAVAHETLPVIGVQWHPERIDRDRSGTDGGRVLEYFVSLIRQGRQ